MSNIWYTESVFIKTDLQQNQLITKITKNIESNSFSQ